jgi:hypothetical protein
MCAYVCACVCVFLCVCASAANGFILLLERGQVSSASFLSLHESDAKEPFWSPSIFLQRLMLMLRVYAYAYMLMLMLIHLRCSAMPSTLLSVIKHMYENDEYILMDGEKRARVHPTNGVKQGCPLSPPFLSLCTSMTWAERSVRALRVP